MAMATKATAIRENPAVVLTPALDPAVEEVPAADDVELVVLDPLVVDGTTATVVDERVAFVVALAPVVEEPVTAEETVVAEETTTTAEEVADVPAVVVPAGAEVTVAVEDGAAEDAAEPPVPEVLRVALVEEPTLPAATQVPATLLEMS